MTNDEFFSKCLRTDKKDPRGTNENAIRILAAMIEDHKKVADPSVRSIAENVGVIGDIAPNFIVFESQTGSFYMHNFKAYQVKTDCKYEVASHEFGHAVLNIANDTRVPEGFEDVIKRAQEYALSPDKKEEFKEYVEFLAKHKDELSVGEKGPVGDIISSIFQQPGFRIGSHDNVCILPAFHQHSYYYDDEKNCMKLKPIFDENFANIYALKALGANKELDKLKSLFGDEFMQVMESQIDMVAQFLERQTTRDVSEEEHINNDRAQIMSAIMGQRSGELVEVREPAELKQDKENTSREDK